MAPQLVTQLASELIHYEPPGIQMILAGNDPLGVHIYVADGGDATCRDTAGFASIGAGYWHANSQFMFASHTRRKSLPETLLLTYFAKKRAEVAPGVDNATDMFTIGPELGSFTLIGDHVLEKLGEIYQSEQKSYNGANDEAKRSIKDYVKEITAAATAKARDQGPVPGTDTGETPAEPKELSESSEEKNEGDTKP